MRNLRRRSSSGYTLLELLVIVAIIGMMVLVSIPSFREMQKRSAVRAAARELGSVFHEARSQAIATGRYTGLRFQQNGDTWEWTLYEDGNWNGIRTAEIAKGIDRRLSGPHVVLENIDKIRIGMPDFPLPDPDTGKLLPPGATPVRFGQSKICSFSPRGASSSGSIFLTDGKQLVAVVRAYGPTARIRAMIYDPRRQQWGSQ
jgi:type II secretory pathway pseudopilin PulG